MSTAPAPAAAAAAPPAKRGGKLVLIVVLGIAVVAGAVFPMLVNVPALFAKSKKEKSENKTAIVPFGDVTVNLSEERMTRYLRVKIAIVVDAESEKEMTEAVTKHKAAIKSKIIGHLAGKTVKDVSGSVGVNRIQRELHDKFDDVLFPDGHGSIRAVLFEEFIVQ